MWLLAGGGERPDGDMWRLAGGGERPDGDMWLPYPADADFVVLRDPDGNEFCVIDHAGLSRP